MLEAVRFLIAFAAPYRKTLITGALTFGLGIVLQLPIPIVTKYLIDRAVPSGNLRMVNMISLAILAIVGVQALSRLIHRIVMIRLHARVQYDLRMRLLRHVETLPIPFFKRNGVGYLHTRLTSDADVAQNLLSSLATELPWGFFTLVVGIIVVFWLQWKMAALCVSLLPVYFLFSLWSGRRARSLAWDAREGYAQVSRDLQEALSGIEVIKAFTCEDEVARGVGRRLSGAIRLEADYQKFVRTASGILSVFSAGVSVLVLWFGCRQVVLGELSLGGLIGFTTALRYLFEPAGTIASHLVELQRSVASAMRIVEIFRLTPEPDRGTRVLSRRVKGALEFRNVTFGYEPGRKVLDGVSFRIAPGERVAIVGKSGVGKSTIVGLVLRFILPWNGRITVDGVDIREIELRSLRKLIAYVPQDGFLFSESVLENIKIGNSSAPLEAILDACRAAALGDGGLSSSLKHRDHIGSAGSCLSGGERQRVAIARALLKNAPILIFDEATSEVDPETDAMIQRTLYELYAGKTILIIAHRLSTVLRADRIIVLDRGKIAAIGRHEYLLRRCDLYRALCEADLVESRRRYAKEPSQGSYGSAKCC